MQGNEARRLEKINGCTEQIQNARWGVLQGFFCEIQQLRLMDELGRELH